MEEVYEVFWGYWFLLLLEFVCLNSLIKGIMQNKFSFVLSVYQIVLMLQYLAVSFVLLSEKVHVVERRHFLGKLVLNLQDQMFWYWHLPVVLIPENPVVYIPNLETKVQLYKAFFIDLERHPLKFILVLLFIITIIKWLIVHRVKFLSKLLILVILNTSASSAPHLTMFPIP